MVRSASRSTTLTWAPAKRQSCAPVQVRFSGERIRCQPGVGNRTGRAPPVAGAEPAPRSHGIPFPLPWRAKPARGRAPAPSSYRFGIALWRALLRMMRRPYGQAWWRSEGVGAKAIPGQVDLGDVAAGGLHLLAVHADVVGAQRADLVAA